MTRPGPPIPARARLARVDHPGENAFNALAHRQLDNAFAIAAREHARGRLLDIGCGRKPYEALFGPHVDEYVGVDHESSPHALGSVDVIASAYEIPLPDASFDTVLMGEVLEHLETPARGLAEAFRLLRPGGKIILTSPFVWVLHEAPRDFYRYSPYGLEHLLGGAGFVDVAVTPLSGQWTTLALLASYALRRSPATRFPRALNAYSRLQQRLAARMDARWFEPWMSWNHLAIARKP